MLKLKPLLPMMLALLIAVLVAGAPMEASAQPNLGLGGANPVMTVHPITGDVCPGPGLIERIVECIKGSVYWATTRFLIPFSNAMSMTVRITLTLAVIFFGTQIALGKKRRLTAETLILALKFAFVLVFSWNFGGMLDVVIICMEWMISTVTGYTSLSQVLACPFSMTMWQRLDCTIDRIIGGVLPGSSMAFGIVGFLVGAIFSGPIGLSICITGLIFVGVVLFAIFKAVYIFLSAYIGICLLVCISPLMVPLMLFRVTKGYFEKWLRLLIGLMIQPIFLFAYLSMLLAAFDVVIFTGERSLYRIISGPSAQIVAPNFRIGGFVAGTGAFVSSPQLTSGWNMNPKELPGVGGLGGMQQTGMWGQLGKAADDLSQETMVQAGNNFGTKVPVSAVNFDTLSAASCGASCMTLDYLIRVLMSLLMAMVVAYIFYIMLMMVPYLGTMLSGEVMSLPNLGKGFDDKLSGFGKQLGGFKPKEGGQGGKPAGAEGGGGG